MASDDSVFRLELKKAPMNGIVGAALRALRPAVGDLRDELDRSRVVGVARRGMI